MRAFEEKIFKDAVSLGAILTAMNALVLVLAIAASEYAAGLSLVERISFAAEDPPWMPPEVEPIYPVFGRHFFGDLMIWMGYAQAPDPYGLDLPPQIPPFGLVIYEGFWATGTYGRATAIYIALTFVCFLSLVWLASKRFDWPVRVFLLVGAGVLTGPFLAAVDRGAFQIVALTMMIAGIQLLAAPRRYLWVLGSFLIVGAVSVKTYLVLLLIWPLITKSRYRRIFFTVSLGLALNVASAFWYGGPLHVLAGFLRGTFMAGGGVGLPWVHQSISLPGLLVKFLSAVWGWIPASAWLQEHAWLLWLPSIAYLSLVILVLGNKALPNWIKAVFVLSLSQLVVPASMIYTGVWASFALLLFVSDVEKGSWMPGNGRSPTEQVRALSRVAVGVALASTLVINPFRYVLPDGTFVNATHLASPLLWAVAILIVLLQSLKLQRNPVDVAR